MAQPQPRVAASRNSARSCPVQFGPQPQRSAAAVLGFAPELWRVPQSSRRRRIPCFSSSNGSASVLPSVTHCSLQTSSSAVLTTFTFPAALAGEEVTLCGSFTDWETPIPLRQAYEDGDHVRSVVLAPGPVSYKFVTNDVWRHSPRDAVSVDSNSNSINNQKVVAINSTITWHASRGDKAVFVAGSFLAWSEIVPLTRNEAGHFSVNCCLPNGKHFIRFLVDRKWQLSKDLPTERAENGELCNVIAVDAAESFHVFCNTGWPSATLRSRMLDEYGDPVSKWTETPLSATQSCLLPWKGCSIPAPRTEDNVAEACQLEFTVLGPHGDVDKPSKNDTYLLPNAGGYKLSSGNIRPFPQACQAPIMLVSDVDGTMIDESDDARKAAWDFREYWENSATLCSSIMVYNTGRSIGQLTGLLDHRKDCMATPDAIITAVGTKIFLLNRRITRKTAHRDSWEEDRGWSELLDEGWNLRVVHDAASRCVGDQVHWLDEGNEHPHRIALSVHRDRVDEVIDKIQDDVEREGYVAQYIVSGMGDYLYVDVLSAQAGKRSAMDYVRRLFGISKERVVTAGDSGNDILMLAGDTPGIVVGNAQPALISWAVEQKQQGEAQTILTDKPLAHGILEGLARHGLY